MLERIPTRNLLIFTDLDGTMLGHDDYAYTKALPAIKLVHQEGIPLVFCSAKTRAEQEVYRHELGCEHPFIVENGGAIFMEHDYFPFDFDYQRIVSGFKVIQLGRPYTEIREILGRARVETGLDIEGYGDVDPERVARLTGLDIQSAGRAMRREYEETIISPLTPEQEVVLRTSLSRFGLRLTRGGRFYSVSGSNDKGEAAAMVADLYRRKNGDVHVIGIGDSFNDEPLLAMADTPVIVQKPDATWERMEVPGLQRVRGVGPEGWNNFIMELLEQ
jgi:mannosyl-3-phosphoglycerate phosphatase